ncbi:MAG: TrkH family potassium uptake protein [Clostridiales bacterium]|nr:TrkH family potassium uptake protein [Clostridiales bacterium]
MNFSMIRFILSQVMRIEGVLMLLPCLVSLIYGDGEGIYYGIVAAFLILTGFIGCRFRPKNQTINVKEGYASTGLSWIVMSLFGCLPFCLSGEIESFTDAFFETVSGFTTTGASILSEVETLSHTALFWRSFTHWIGGMGVLVFLLALIPMSGGSNINLMKAESPGPSVGKLVPKIRYTAMILYVIYVIMTVIETVFLLIGGLDFFESICLAFGTAGTGGFAVRNDSFMSYGLYIRWVVGIFMFLFGVNFNAYYLIYLKQIKKAFSLEEVRVFFSVVALSTIIIFVKILPLYENAITALTDAFFQVTSVVSTTGYGSADFDLWPSTAKFVMCFLMFMGACAGSTGGGVKVSRFMIFFKSVTKEVQSYIHPKIVKKVTIDKKGVEPDVIRSTLVFLATYAAIFLLSMFIVSFDNYDMTTTFTSILATLNNIGPGLSKVGATCNYGFLSTLSKWTLTFDMLAGRLELFPILILFAPSLYKK